MIVRNTKKEEAQRVNELFGIAFELPPDDGPADEENDRVHHWAAFEDETNAMMSTFTISDYRIQFDGFSCKMGGIGGVATLPQYRRRGGIRECFNAALPDMYKNGYDFSYLYPFSTAYYRKFGYECCVQKMNVSVDLGHLKPVDTKGQFYLAEVSNPMSDAIRAIDSIWENRYNMMVIHSEEDYDWTKKFDPAKKQEFTYVYFDEDHQPKAYTTFKLANQADGRNLACSKFFFVDQEGFHGLMNLFKSLSADHVFVKFSLPAKCDIEYLLPEWAMGAATWSIQNAGMVRVINVKSALEMARYHGSGSLVLQILDSQIPENNNTFAIMFKDGHCESVRNTNTAPDTILQISTFSALLSGVTDFDSASMWMNGLTIVNENPALHQMFYKKPMMIADYF